MKKISFLPFFLFAALSVESQGIDLQKENVRGSVYVEMQTTYGNIVVLLYDVMIQGGDPDSKTAKPGQMLGEGSMGYNIDAEFRPGLFHKRGALAAAREGDDVNPKKESSSCQFYIVQGRTWSDDELNMIGQRYKKDFTKEQREAYRTIGGAPHLDGDYTVYGEVVEGMDIVDKIAAARRDRFDRPLDDIKIISAKVIKK